VLGGYVDPVDRTVEAHYIVPVRPADRLRVAECLRRVLMVNDAPRSRVRVAPYCRLVLRRPSAVVLETARHLSSVVLSRVRTRQP